MVVPAQAVFGEVEVSLGVLLRHLVRGRGRVGVNGRGGEGGLG